MGTLFERMEAGGRYLSHDERVGPRQASDTCFRTHSRIVFILFTFIFTPLYRYIYVHIFYFYLQATLFYSQHTLFKQPILSSTLFEFYFILSYMLLLMLYRCIS